MKEKSGVRRRTPFCERAQHSIYRNISKNGDECGINIHDINGNNVEQDLAKHGGVEVAPRDKNRYGKVHSDAGGI